MKKRYIIEGMKNDNSEAYSIRDLSLGKDKAKSSIAVFWCDKDNNNNQGISWTFGEDGHCEFYDLKEWINKAECLLEQKLNWNKIFNKALNHTVIHELCRV
jgi:hypothetical protein